MKRIETIVTETKEDYQIGFANDIHKVETINDTHIVTTCGISTWSDLHSLSQNEILTCERCKTAVKVYFSKDNVIKNLENDEVLYSALSFKDARKWCYERGAMGFSVRYGIAKTQVYINETN